MVKTDNPWLFPANSTLHSRDSKCMSTSLEPVQPGCLPALASPGTFPLCGNMIMPGFAVPSIPSLKAQSNEIHRLPQYFPPHFQNLHPATNSYLNENQALFSNGIGGEAAPNDIPASQRRFVIFDQSGSGTRLIYTSFCPTVPKPTITAANPIEDHHEERAANVNLINLTKPKLDEVSDENHTGAKGSDMHEDTEEINALLYSEDDDYDDDDDDDDDCGGTDDDEVTSTGHSPVLIGGNYGAQEAGEEMAEEVASSDGPNKRQKLLDGGYRISSVVNTASSIKFEGPHIYDVNAESSCAIGQTKEEIISILGNKQSRKDKIRATLKVLKTIIPGAQDKDPLSVLDEAIYYLKSLKLEARTLGVNYH